MPVWLSVTSLRFCAQTAGNPVTAVEAAMAAPLFRIARREILRSASDSRALFISISLEVLTRCLYAQPLPLRAPNALDRCEPAAVAHSELSIGQVEDTRQPLSMAAARP